MSFQNVQMYGAVLPSYNSKEDSDTIEVDDNLKQADELLGIKR